MYLEILIQTLIWMARVFGIISLILMALGFIASWFNEGLKYSATKGRKAVDWIMPTVWRRFFRIVSPPALVFGIPAIIVAFS